LLLENLKIKGNKVVIKNKLRKERDGRNHRQRGSNQVGLNSKPFSQKNKKEKKRGGEIYLPGVVMK